MTAAARQGLLWLGCLAAASSARAASSIGLVASPYQDPALGGDVVVAVRISPADNVTAMDFVYAYDASVLAPTGVFKTGYTNAFNLTSTVATPGIVEIHLSGQSPLAGSGDVAWVEFKIQAAGATTTPLSWVSASLNAGAIQTQPTGLNLIIHAASVTIQTPDNSSAGPGSQVIVPIEAGPLNNAGSFDLTLTYNPAVLSAVSVERTSLTSCMNVVSNFSTAGTVNIALYGVCTISGAGPLARVVFNVLGPLGSRSPLNVTRGGINEGRIGSVLDDGLFTVCLNSDGDADGYSTCAGDCNDANSKIHPGAAETCNALDDDCDGLIDNAPVPRGIPSLLVGGQGSVATLLWASIYGATGYDALCGRVSLLQAAAGDFSISTTRCLGNDLPATQASDSAVPVPGDAFWYLVRAVSCGGPGSYEEAPDSPSRGRDAGIAASSFGCP